MRFLGEKMKKKSLQGPKSRFLRARPAHQKQIKSKYKQWEKEVNG
jgi:hypothetical protein